MSACSEQANAMPSSSMRLNRPLVVRHPALDAPVLVDGGPSGSSAGDQRFWFFTGRSDTGETVLVDWVMSTTRGSESNAEEERRLSDGVFSFSSKDGNQIVLNGVAIYSTTNNTLQPDATATRAMTGGTGRYSGAAGEIFSERFPDGSWSHTFLFSRYDVQVGTTGSDQLTAGNAPSSCMAGLEGADSFAFTQRKRQGNEPIDIITDFNVAENDQIQLDRSAFPGIDQVNLMVVNSTRRFKRAADRSATLVFDQTTGLLAANLNGPEAGWGAFGGPFVALTPGISLRPEAIQLI